MKHLTQIFRVVACRCALYIGLFAVSAVNLPVAAAQTAIEPLDVEEIAAGVFVHFGRHEDMTAANAGDIANVGFVVGDSAVAVIDPGGSVRLGEQLAAAIEANTPLPVKFIIITHVHPDHIFGASAFVDSADTADIAVYGHHKLAQAIAQRGEFYLQRMTATIGSAMDGATIVAPTHAVEDSVVIDLGNRELTLRAHGVAHTDHDLSVVDEKTRLLWAGDLLFDTRIPSLDGSLIGWLAVMDRLESLSLEGVIPGHGNVGEPAPLFSKQREYLTALLNETREAVAKNERLQSAVETIANPAAELWQLHELHHKGNITKAYTELEWE